MDSQLKAMHDKFVTQGYPVIIVGEYCACNKTDAITQQGIIDAIMSGIGSNITPTPTTSAPTPTSTSTPTPTASQNPRVARSVTAKTTGAVALQ
jgi:hypothetical protein